MYKVMISDAPPNAENLDELASEGWHLIQILEWRGRFYIYLKSWEG